MNRVSIDVPELAHGELPIPTASRIGCFVQTGGIRGVDRNTGHVPDDAAIQADLMFDNLMAVLAAAGATPDDVLKVTVWLKRTDLRPVVNRGWLKWFPNPASRPARHVLIYELPGNMAIQCEALAICGGKKDASKV